MARQSSPEELRRRAAVAWLDDARADLASARTLAVHRDEHTAPFAAAFHAEQAVEKALKALLLVHGVDFPPKHDLGLLVSLLPDGMRVKALNIAGLTVYAVEQRYASVGWDPERLNERPTWDEAEMAISRAEQALVAASADLAAAGIDGGQDP